jgi:hypothetical protein
LTDLNAAALLLVAGCRLVEIAPTATPRRRAFVVSGDPDTVRQVLDAYRDGHASVPAKALITAQRQLKRLLFAQFKTSQTTDNTSL